MARRWRVVIVIAILTMILATILASELFRPLNQARDFHIPSAAEAARARSLFADALEGANRGALADQAASLGPEMRRVDGGVASLALRESEGECLGRGLYRLRDDAGLPLALVAPHRGSDRHTGTLAQLLFEEMPVTAAAWNSAPRRVTDACPGGGDATRVDTHFLTAFSLAFADKNPGGRIVQLHGFEQGKRTSSAAQLADIIVSEGSEEPSARLLDLADCLSVALHPMAVAVFPLDTGELGAQQNRQGRAVRGEGFEGFAHLELSANLRERLVTDKALRAHFGACLVEGLE